MQNEDIHSSEAKGHDDIALTEITVVLKRILMALQKVNRKDDASVSEIVANFQKVFAGVRLDYLCEKLPENRASVDPDAKFWTSCLNMMKQNCTTVHKIEEDIVEEVTNPYAMTNGVMSSHQTNNQQQNVGTLTHQTNNSTQQPPVVDTRGFAVEMSTEYNDNSSPSLFVEKKKKRKKSSSKSSRQSDSSSSSSSSDENELPDENSNSSKRTTPKRKAKSAAIKTINKMATPEDMSDSESIDIAVPKSKSRKTDKKSSPSSSKQATASSSTSTPPAQDTTPRTTSSSSTVTTSSSTFIEDERRTNNIVNSWTTTLRFLKDSTPIPSMEKIKSDIITASIKSSQATGFNYAKMVQNTIPKNVLKLWNDYPLTFFLLSYKIMQEIKGIVKTITTILEEDEELGAYYKKKPYAGCPPINKLGTLL